ncbi:NAD(P)-binding domain-containing protein [Flavobacterium daemonense]|uniref:NAD(P)-binding domain-containing protein n=1 Tax=Flavobacterium daemonense TaxID=1393049 RepID=UPI001185DFED|nr:NAD(P)-binding domain-containing protein [Flavobacterium daemonense]KAF2330626.1 NAD(P)-binding domain-containing protein [Flavobacterium daemonense]
MTIGIIGVCSATLNFATRAIEYGHEVLISHYRNNESMRATVQEMGCNVKFVSKEKAAKAKIIILFVPFEEIDSFMSDLPDMTGKILIHTNNSIFSMECLQFELRTKLSSEIIARLLPKAYSLKILTILNPNLISPVTINANEIFYLTTNQKIKKKVDEFLETLNFSPYDFEEICRINASNEVVNEFELT